MSIKLNFGLLTLEIERELTKTSMCFQYQNDLHFWQVKIVQPLAFDKMGHWLT